MVVVFKVIMIITILKNFVKFRNHPNEIVFQRGKVGLHKLGVSFRQRYDGFLSAKYSPSQIRIQSSDYDRCLMSASLVLAGLYPPIGVQLWNPDLQWQPIPVHSAPLQCDDVSKSHHLSDPLLNPLI